MKTIGFIGTGMIGNPMARALLRAGFHLKAHDQNPKTLESVLAAGAEPVRGPADLQDAEAVVIMVNTMDQVNAVLLGKQGLVAGWGDGPKPVVVVMSTVSPEGIRELREQLDPEEIRLLDAPVSGGAILAEQGKLAIMVGGLEEDLALVRPIFEGLGDKIYHVGPLGAGMAMKLVNNMIAITSMLIVPEALALGAKYGLPADRMVDIINTSSGKTFITENWEMHKLLLQIIMQKDDPFGARQALFTTGRKDLETAKNWASSQGFTTPVLERVIDGLSAMDADFFAERISEILEQEKSP